MNTTALITGGTSGIGRATAKKLAQLGTMSSSQDGALSEVKKRLLKSRLRVDGQISCL